MPEFGIEDHEPLQGCLSELSERRAAITRKMLEGDRSAPPTGSRARPEHRRPDAAWLLEGLQRTSTPTVYALGWGANGTTHGRGTFNLTMSVINPGPIYWTSLYVHVFFGRPSSRQMRSSPGTGGYAGTEAKGSPTNKLSGPRILRSDAAASQSMPRPANPAAFRRYPSGS
jgi:hypothetical protein